MKVFRGIRPMDYVLAGVFTAWGVYLMIQNMNGAFVNLPHPRSTTTGAMLPFFLAVTVPILWRRRNVLGSVMVTAVATAMHVFLFGYQTRCEVLVPLSIALAYAVGRFADGRRDHLTCLAGIFLLQVVMLGKDTSIDKMYTALPLTVPVAALFYGIGYFVQTRVTKRHAALAAAA